MERPTLTVEEIENMVEEFISSHHFHILHGDIGERKKISEWGMRWLIEEIRRKEKVKEFETPLPKDK